METENAEDIQKISTKSSYEIHPKQVKFSWKTYCDCDGEIQNIWIGAIHISSPCYRTTSRKFIIKSKDKDKYGQLRKCKFSTPNNFQMKFFQLWKTHEEKHKEKLKKNKTEKKKKITPIKILICRHDNCQEKFTKSDELQRHVEKDHQPKLDSVQDKLLIDQDIKVLKDLKSPEVIQEVLTETIVIEDSSDDEQDTKSEGELLIDDDVEFVMEENDFEIPSLKVPCIKKESSPNQVLKNKHLCNFCDEEFSRQSSLTAHIKLSHHKNTKTSEKLEVSSRGSSSENGNILYFKRYDTNKDNFICRICSSKYKQRTHLDRHFVTLHVSKLFICTKCEIEFTGRVEMHLNNHHGSELSGQNYIQELEKIQMNQFSFCCPICSYKSKDRKRVEEHLTDEHYENFEKESYNEIEEKSNQSLTPTKHLLQNLIQPDSMQKIIELTEKLKTSNSYLKHRCFRCQERFQTRDDLKVHQCIQIQPITLSQTNLKQSRPSLNGFYSCKCSKYFTNKKLYEEHCNEEHK